MTDMGLVETWEVRKPALESAAGGLSAAAGPALDDEATHACLADAASKEDSARVSSMRALDAVRN